MTNDFVRIDRGHGYKTSRDYSALYDLALKQAVICIVDYNKSRDTAATIFHGGTLQVSARGICYISAETREDFVSQCGQADLEYLDPESQVAVPDNLCEKCLSSWHMTKPDINLFETGKCGACGEVGDVADLDLLALYRGLGFSESFIHAQLPRLRHHAETTLSWEDVGRAIAKHVIAGQAIDLQKGQKVAIRPGEGGCR